MREMDAEQTQFAGRSKHGAKEGRTLPEKNVLSKVGYAPDADTKDALGTLPSNVQERDHIF